jgi:hypothetical protein
MIERGSCTCALSHFRSFCTNAISGCSGASSTSATRRNDPSGSGATTRMPPAEKNSSTWSARAVETAAGLLEPVEQDRGAGRVRGMLPVHKLIDGAPYFLSAKLAPSIGDVAGLDDECSTVRVVRSADGAHLHRGTG